MISIILPVYNVCNYIDRCLQTLVEQTYTDLEIILVDDCSTDGSGNVCDKWKNRDQRINVVHHSERGGVSSARNTGLEYATGDLITFVDPDDYVDKNLYKTVISYCERNEIVGFGYHIVNEQTKETKSLYELTSIENSKNHKEITEKNYSKLIGLSLDDLHRWNCGGNINSNRAKGMVWQFVFSANLIKSHNARFDTKITLKEDEIFVMEIMTYAESVFIVDKPLYYYVQHESSICHSMTTERMIENKENLLKAKNRIREKVKKDEYIDLLPLYAASNVLSILEIGMLCAKMANGYRQYLNYINAENIRESIRLIPLEKGNPKFTILLVMLKLKMWKLCFNIIKLAQKMGVGEAPKNI